MITALERRLDTAGDGLLFVARILLAFIFLHEAVTLTIGFEAAVLTMNKVGVPGPLLAAAVVLQAGAGLSLALGWHGRLGALALGLFCLATAFRFHTDFANHNELLHFEKDLAIAGGMFVLAVAGTGLWSMDRLRRLPGARL